MTASRFSSRFTRAALYGSVLSLLLVACTSGDEKPKAATELDKNALVRLADRMRLQGDSGMAADFYQRAIAEDPQNVAAYYGLATMQVASGDRAGAERAYREALRYDAHNGDILRDYAKLLLSEGNFTAAVAQYRAALAQNSKDVRALNGLGVALDQAGDHKTAQEQYRAVLAQNQDDMAALNNLGMSLIMAGDYNGAIQQLAPVAETFKATEGLRQNLALAYAKAGQDQPALNAIAPPAQYMDFTRATPPVEPAVTPAALAVPVVPPPPAPDAIAAALAVPAVTMPIAQPILSVLPSAAPPITPAAVVRPAVQATAPREDVALPSITELAQPAGTLQRWKNRRSTLTPLPTPAALAVTAPMTNVVPPPVAETPVVPAVMPAVQAAASHPDVALPSMTEPAPAPSIRQGWKARRSALATPPDAPVAQATTPAVAATPEIPASVALAVAPPAATMAATPALASRDEAQPNVAQRRRVTAGGALTNIAFRSAALPLAPSAAALPASAPQRAVFGPYATDGIAQAQQALMQQQLGARLPAKAVSNIVTQLTPAGTPEFAVHVYGFTDADMLTSFCTHAATAGYPCRLD